ncbi:MAG: extensin family protein [Myxococcota bacterium]
MAPLRRAALSLALAAFAFASPARADEAARIEALRGRAPDGILDSIAFLFYRADRIERSYEAAAASWRRRGTRYLSAVEAGEDPYAAARGEIVNRAYRSAISPELQGYAVYIPPNYDPERSYPLYIALHGGSSNGNLFLGVVLGNNMDWVTYDEHLYDDYTPRWSPDWIVVAPTGFGQVMWRWMGEQDVLDVMDDVIEHYNVDEDRVVLGGLSNGGVGAYSVGVRHAWRFASVQAMAGAPSWLQYTGGGLRPVTRNEVMRYSGLHLAENWFNTKLRYYHGRSDGGPMRPSYVEAFTRHLGTLSGVTAEETWFDAGHDILYRAHRHGRVYDRLTERRNPRPTEVRLVSGDYRAAEQHWVRVERFANYPELGEVRGSFASGTLALTTEGVRAFSLNALRLPGEGAITVRVDGDEVYRGPRIAMGQRFYLKKRAGGWVAGFLEDEGLAKVRGLSGPISDAYYGRMVHVYGTQNAADTDDLRRAAERGARGWPLWAWHLGQEVIADTEVTPVLAQSATLVLYATPGSNAALTALEERLPIRVDAQGVALGSQRFDGPDMGVRFIHPNPDAPSRYVIVQSAVTSEAVRRGNKLPEFLPDYAIYRGRELRGQQRRVAGRSRLEQLGNFDQRWRLPGAANENEASDAETSGGSQARDGRDVEAGEAGHTRRAANPEESEGRHAHGPIEGGDPSEGEAITPGLPVPRAPAVPRPPQRFAADADDGAGRAARRIASLVPTFVNYRAQIGGAEWVVDPAHAWSIRNTDECLAQLEELGVPARPRPAMAELVPAAVEVLGPVGGIHYRLTHEERPFVVSCELAARLPQLSAILASHDVEAVEVLSTYRTHPTTSFHRMGLALDLSRFWVGDRFMDVQRDYEATPLRRTCSGRAPSGDAGTLRAIACELWAARIFSSVLTPNYNEGHRDHLHLDMRPDDPRFFLR